MDQGAGRGRWETARERGAALASAEICFGERDERHWDYVGVRDIIAVTVFALAERDQVLVEAVPLHAVLYQLEHLEQVRALLDLVAAACNDASDQDARGFAEAVAWLERVWDPRAPVKAHLDGTMWPGISIPDPRRGRIEPRWAGMTRGIATSLPDPALEVCLLHAYDAVSDHLLAQSGGIAPYTRVSVIDGLYQGQKGYVRGPVWDTDPEREQAIVPPYGYVVGLDEDVALPLPVVPAEALSTRADGLSWPALPPGCAAGRIPRPSTAVQETCAEQLAKILRGAENPEAVPEDLRAAVEHCQRYAPFLIERRATPRPNRVTWSAFGHCFTGSAGARVSVFEVQFAARAADPDPVRVLAVNESVIQAIIAVRASSGLPASER